MRDGLVGGGGANRANECPLLDSPDVRPPRSGFNEGGYLPRPGYALRGASASKENPRSQPDTQVPD